MNQANGVKRIIVSHIVAWLLAVIFLSLFIPDSFDWFLHPFVMAVPIAAGALIRLALFRRRQQRISASN